MTYPSEREIIDFFNNLPTAVADEFAPVLERAQRDYRRVWQQLEQAGKDDRVRVLSQFAADVFRTRVAKQLRERTVTFEEFRVAISMDGGDAELACWYAHRLYNLVERGGMLSTWHRQIRSALFGLITEAENLWYTPDMAPVGWEAFVDCGPTSAAEANNPEPVETVDPQPKSLEATGEGTHADAKDSTTAEEGAADGHQGRRKVVEGFIQRCSIETGIRPKRNMIWKAAGYTQRSDFDRWQGCKPTATKSADENFRRILAMPPDEFIAVLKKQRLIS